MMATRPRLRGPNVFERLLDALVDPQRRERAMGLFLLFYLAVWSLYGAIAKGSQDLHFDMGEMIAWSRETGIGTPKHPPLAAWLVGGWFAVFPRADWAYYLFAMVIATAALWIAWRLFAAYLDPEKRVTGLLLLTFIPFYNFHALKFNANTVLIPLWAAATWWFLRSFETRRAGWAALAGIGAAAAMMGKYWSIFLLAGLGIAALSDPRRGEYFRSTAPWITIAVGAGLLVPHVLWIVASDFAPFGYALDAHPATFARAIQSAFGFIAGICGYISAPVVLVALAARPTLVGLADILWPAAPERRFNVIAFAAPLLLAALTALVLRVGIVSLWAMSAMTLLPVVLLSSPHVALRRRATVWLLALAIVFPLAMVVASPFIAAIIHREGVSNYATHYRQLARAVEQTWREHTAKPLRIIGSYTNIINGTVFYFASTPATFDFMSPEQTPWVDEARIVREGIALVCPVPVTYCLQAIERRVARGGATAEADVTIARTYFGHADEPVRYRIVIFPPR